MNLLKKRQLAARALKVGKKRILFDEENLNDIKEAITKQDIKDLHDEGIILIRPIKGRKKIVKRKTRRGFGKIKKTIRKRKIIYVKLTRKLRAYILKLRQRQMISPELYTELRKKVKNKTFRSESHLKEYLESATGIAKPLKIFRKQKEHENLKKTVKSKEKIKNEKTE